MVENGMAVVSAVADCGDCARGVVLANTVGPRLAPLLQVVQDINQQVDFVQLDERMVDKHGHRSLQRSKHQHRFTKLKQKLFHVARSKN